MIECEDGREEKAQSGNVGLAGSSFFNRAEALLALRSVSQILTCSFDASTAFGRSQGCPCLVVLAEDQQWD